MPTQDPAPTIAEFRTAYADAIHGQRDPFASTRTGGGYDLVGGANAVLWSRQMRRGEWLYEQGFDDSATGTALDDRIEKIYGVTRVPAAYGVGSAILQRPAAGASGTIWAGTRIEIVSPASANPPAQYVVTSNTTCAAAITSLKVPVRASRKGTGVAVKHATQNLRMGDIVFDSTFVPVLLNCTDGTDAESADEYRARAKTEQLKRRKGYPAVIETALRDAGAAHVVLLHSGTFGAAYDFGLNYAYVADAGFSTPDALIKACRLAAERARVAGCDFQVCGMTPTALSIAATIYLWDQPAKFDTAALKTATTESLMAEFNSSTKFWTFKTIGLQGLVQRVSDDIQTVVVTTSPAEPTPGFVTSLPRYVVAANAVTVTFAGPA